MRLNRATRSSLWTGDPRVHTARARVAWLRAVAPVSGGTRSVWHGGGAPGELRFNSAHTHARRDSAPLPDENRYFFGFSGTRSNTIRIVSVPSFGMSKVVGRFFPLPWYKQIVSVSPVTL